MLKSDALPTEAPRPMRWSRRLLILTDYCLESLISILASIFKNGNALTCNSLGGFHSTVQYLKS